MTKTAEQVAKDAFRKAIERNDITSVYDDGALIGKITLSSCVSPKIYDECIESVVKALREAGMLKEEDK